MAGKTEWEDILIKKGIMEAPPKQPSKDEMNEVRREAAESLAQQMIENATLDQLDEMENDLDEDVLNRYREQRIAEMKERAEKEKFGTVLHIRKTQFVDEVTKASEEAPVVCHLFKDGIPACQVVLRAMEAVARKFKMVKFVKIFGEDCIENYPDHAMPTLVIYKDGKMVKQLTGINEMGGIRMTDLDLEWLLAALNILETDLQEDPRRAARTDIKQKSKGSIRGTRGHDSEEEDDDF